MDTFHLIIELIAVLIVVSLQLYFFFSTKKRMKILSSYFPEQNDREYGLASDYSSGSYQQIDLNENYSFELYNVIETINSYLKKNSGTADFSIIENIVERDIESKDNLVSTNISLPLYIGLMGTFIGIIIGLIKIAFGGGITDSNINSFLGGVVIAMTASFFGLLLTVLNNSKNFKESKTICNEGKKYFYDFLQVELLPHIGTTLVDTLDRLKNNISDFNNKFENNINLFDSKFSENINSLSVSVQSLSENINSVVENTNTQKEFLVELKRMGYNRMAEANIKVFKLLKEAGPTFIKFVESQKELTDSIENANQFVEIIENILNRVKTFEESINNLGDQISTKEYLGNEVLTRIDANLNYLDKQFELLKQHEHKSTDAINEYFGKKFKEIQTLSDNIRKEIQEAMNFRIDSNPLLKLNHLEPIELKLDDLNKKINLNGDIKSIFDNISKTNTEIQEIKNTLIDAVKKAETKKRTPKAKNDPVVKKPEKRNFFRRLIRI
jgi:biopolymer transport protein ExbB/TolQ/predicted  nucleic acid-binding Zn-ribbon protein